MDGKVYCMLVTKNESSRYLNQFIEHHDFFDGYFLYDDRSDDDTVQIAKDAGWKTIVRDKDDPSFMQHEGQFRFNSWRSFEQAVKPTIDDWVLSIDADEFLVSDTDLDVEEELKSTIDRAEEKNLHLVIMFRREVWKMDASGCYLRVDGFWKNDRLFRLFKYKPNGTWSKKPMGCGSAPLYVGNNGLQTSNLTVIHFGYTNEEDKQERYDRYTSLVDHGHNDKHIKSIIVSPQLKKYSGPVPEWVNRKINGI